MKTLSYFHQATQASKKVYSSHHTSVLSPFRSCEEPPSYVNHVNHQKSCVKDILTWLFPDSRTEQLDVFVIIPRCDASQAPPPTTTPNASYTPVM